MWDLDPKNELNRHLERVATGGHCNYYLAQHRVTPCPDWRLWWEPHQQGAAAAYSRHRAAASSAPEH